MSIRIRAVSTEVKEPEVEENNKTKTPTSESNFVLFSEVVGQSSGATKHQQQ